MVAERMALGINKWNACESEAVQWGRRKGEAITRGAGGGISGCLPSRFHLTEKQTVTPLISLSTESWLLIWNRISVRVMWWRADKQNTLVFQGLAARYNCCFKQIQWPESCKTFAGESTLWIFISCECHRVTSKSNWADMGARQNREWGVLLADLYSRCKS